MPTWTLARKDLRLLARDTRALVILLAMPLIFILVLGLSLGEGFGQKPDDRLRVSVVNLDKGLPEYKEKYPGRRWSEVVLDDLAAPTGVQSPTSGIRIEIIDSRERAEQLVREGKRAAVLVFKPDFSEKVQQCSFLADGDPPPINPFYRDGVDLDGLSVEVLRDPTQDVAASIIEQVAQVTMLRVVMPWMIGKAFDRVGDPAFMESMGKYVPLWALVPGAAKKDVGPGVKLAIKNLFRKYDLTAKTWADLTKNAERPKAAPNTVTAFHDESGSGFISRGAARYQVLVPSYTVMFAFFMVLTVGWLFVAERRQGTLLRLRAAPLSRSQIIFGKLIPCLLLSLFQGFFLLGSGRLVFGMSWGAEPLWVVPVVVTTALAATGMAMLVASVARSETQVAIYGTLLVLVLAGVSGCLMPRDLMPEQMKEISRVTPHAWALDAYSQLLVNPNPSAAVVFTACLVLTGFGVGFLLLAWLLLRLD
jgi:ABC-type Na+ efflux pump permease subunit